MPRVTALPPTALPPEIAEVYERFTAYGPFDDQASVMAHVPPALDHLYRMLMELKTRQAVPWRYIELGIVVASKLNACAYCVASHSPVLSGARCSMCGTMSRIARPALSNDSIATTPPSCRSSTSLPSDGMPRSRAAKIAVAAP